MENSTTYSEVAIATVKGLLKDNKFSLTPYERLEVKYDTIQSLENYCGESKVWFSVLGDSSRSDWLNVIEATFTEIAISILSGEPIDVN